MGGWLVGCESFVFCLILTEKHWLVTVLLERGFCVLDGYF